MYELKKIGMVFTSKFIGTGPSSHEKRIYRVAVSQRLRNTVLHFLIWQFWQRASLVKHRETFICFDELKKV